MFGYNSEISFIRSHNLGVFMANNLSNYTLENRYIVDFIVDVMIGEVPWLDAIGFCAIMDGFPSPFSGQTAYETYMDAYNNGLYDMQPFYQITPSEASVSLIEDVHKYIGQYGNFIYRYATISWNEEEENLELSVGPVARFRLEATEDIDILLGKAANDESFVVRQLSLKFSNEDDEGVYQTLDLPIFDLFMSTRFERGLTMDQAPQPNTSCISEAV